MSKPRSEIFFPAIQTAKDLNYVPKPTRDAARAEWFSDKPAGIVIAWQQKVGSVAASRAFDRIVETGNENDIENVSNLLALTSFGTAYHVFAEHDAERVMYRRAKIPRLINPDTKERVTQDDLLASAQTGLANAADLAMMIETLLIEDKPSKQLQKKSRSLGRILAPTGATLAAIQAGAADLHTDEEGMQWYTWLAAQGAYLRMLELSGKIDTRPTIAQLPDTHSPLRRFMNDDQQFTNKTTHKVLLEEVEEAASISA